MIAIVLAGGFGTRLRGVMSGQPKGLIRLGGESLLDRLCGELETLSCLNAIVVVSNDLYCSQLTSWAEQRSMASAELIVINDGARSHDARLGAVGDLAFAIRHLSVSEPVFVAASDCFFTFPLVQMQECFDAQGGNWIAVAQEQDPSALIDGAVVEVDSEGNVTFLEEKPSDPKSNLGALPFYCFEAATLPLVENFLLSGGNPDSPGRFPEWLYTRRRLQAHIIDQKYQCCDIGTPAEYARLRGR